MTGERRPPGNGAVANLLRLETISIINSVPMSEPETPKAIRFPLIVIKAKSGTERFVSDGRAIDTTLSGFWSWVASDLVDNTNRGLLAEFIVAQALGLAGEVRVGWAPYDIRLPSGVRVEVKASGFLQSWGQSSHSKISFSIRSTRAFDGATNTMESQSRRQADLYVFCLLKHLDKSTVDPLNLDQWEFYVVPTRLIEHHCGPTKAVTLARLRSVTSACSYESLRKTIEKAAASME